ncbi:helicase-related protein [Nocardiopsis algeriensis]|uniref:Superfamily II DNA or RNA helicase n=1 Tax=Nocardiopsis algeriensis TaxID=1478215 RepID=A0A841IMZ4_9ACTN|nr:superfamily II DNA or RNA helicase [Nocardiopsis algeriensis]
MRLEELEQGLQVEGVLPSEPVTVLFVQWHGTSAVELTYKSSKGELDQRVLFRKDEERLRIARSDSRAFDADAVDFKLAAEAQRITLAGLFDPMLAVATSDVEPLPHQIRAVYGELLPRTPLRFLLADDPGAGKTIMAGLYVKELILRDDVKRCLVVAPGGLVEQWQDELFLKFGLHFDLLTNDLIDANVNLDVFETHPLLIARMDHLARNEHLLGLLRNSEWDLVIVDEAHRMGAHRFGGKVDRTKRFQLGELLGEVTRHLLLMTATPHSGKEEDFQLFLTLLDRDRFEGRSGSASTDTSGIMRRMVKEDLLTFDGRRLFPERIAETVPYELTALEYDLYEQVTAYVREGMDRAERIGGTRQNSIGFALTVLQRRLASSPEAIHRSLVRRADRLEQRKRAVLNGERRDPSPALDHDLLDGGEYSAEEIENLEDTLLDTATAARTAEELDAEITELAELARTARAVRDSGQDRKWTELSRILRDQVLVDDRHGNPRKLIVFTEHRDTLSYLASRIRALHGRGGTVLTIHGGMSRRERRAATEEFTHNRDCRILVATDAAGEGLNLQAAHLMVNYDLPWNPNRIEQRFGRIHRIGQTEVCRLWNLVAANTREGLVFTRLLDKVDEQRRAYGGKVFDVLGESFTGTPLRELLTEAIRYGERPETRARMHQVIDASVGEGLDELLNERSLASAPLSDSELRGLRAQMDEARARRLQPHYIETAFRSAFTRLGGRIVQREKGRYEITHVPAGVRAAGNRNVASSYARVTFSPGRTRPEGRERAELLAPGQPLHDAVMEETIRRYSGALNSGTVLVSPTLEEPRLLVGVVEEVTDGTGAIVDRRLGYSYVDEYGTVTPAGPAAYLDCAPAPDTAAVAAARGWTWMARARETATSWIIGHRLPEYVNQVRPRREAELDRTRGLVAQRLRAESARLRASAAAAREKELCGERPKESSESLARKATELDVRLERRMSEIERQTHMSARSPRILTSALVLPAAMVEQDLTPGALFQARETKEVERRGIDAVLAVERALGRAPQEQAFNNPGYDILSTQVDGERIRIEVKARMEGAQDFFVTHNEVLTARNAAPRYRLALVRVDSRGPAYDEVRYLADPFATTDLGGFEATGVVGDWSRTWARGKSPF